MINVSRNLQRVECVECRQIIVFSKRDFLCESCKGKQNLIKILGGASVAGFSLFCPPLAGAAAEVRKLIEDAIIGNPSEKKIYELHNIIETLNRELKSSEQRVKNLEKANSRLQKEINQRDLGKDWYITTNNPWIKIAENPAFFGIIGLERVNKSTRFEYCEYPLFIDLFFPDPEGKGLLHGGISIEVISPMIAESKMRKPMLYSYRPEQLTQAVDRIM